MSSNAPRSTMLIWFSISCLRRGTRGERVGFWRSGLQPNPTQHNPSHHNPTQLYPSSFSPLEAHHTLQPIVDAHQPHQQVPSKGLSTILSPPGACCLLGTHRTRSCFSPEKSFLWMRVMLLPLSSLGREEAEVRGKELRSQPGTAAPQSPERHSPKDSSGHCISEPSVRQLASLRVHEAARDCPAPHPAHPHASLPAQLHIILQGNAANVWRAHPKFTEPLREGRGNKKADNWPLEKQDASEHSAAGHPHA